MINSIKLKLLILFLIVFSLFFTGLELFLYYKLEDLGTSLADEHVKFEIQTIANLMAVEETQGHFEMGLSELSVAVTGEYANKLSGHYYQIVADDGKILVRSPSLSLANVSLPVIHSAMEPDFRTVIGPNNEPIRMVSQTMKFTAGKLTFQAGDSVTDTYRLLSSFRNTVLAVFPAIFIVCAVGVYVMTGLALRALKFFSLRVGLITEENLDERLDEEGMVTELRPLAASFNTMLGRLEGSFTRQKQFLSDASHELRTPTSIIKSYCDVTLGKERETKEYRDSLKKINETVNRMCDIINRILVISRMENRTVQLKPSRMNIMDIMKDVFKLIEPSAAQNGVEMSLSGSGAVIRGDREGLTEVFTNLIENAVKYNKPGGRVDVDVGCNQDFVIVTIEDTGIGIPQGETQKIFDRFYRVDASRGVTAGSGLGLSIVRTIVEAHGGRVTVKSEPGRGSAFQVFLPISDEPRNFNSIL